MKSFTRAFDAKRRKSAETIAVVVESALARADRARDAREWDLAARAYGDALAGSPGLANVWVQYGHALKETNRLEDAEGAYRKALALDPATSDTHLQLGHLLKIQGRREEAAEAYLNALELDYGCSDAFHELDGLARGGAKLPADRAMAVLGALPQGVQDSASPPAVQESADGQLRSAIDALGRLSESRLLDEQGALALEGAMRALLGALDKVRAPADAASRVVLVFDVADLLGYFHDARLPTGIQRVQIEVVRVLCASPNGGADIRVCGFVEAQDDWVAIPTPFFRRLCALSLKSGDVTDPEWAAIIGQLDLLMLSSEPLNFPDNACLVNLGTSWWLQNYFLNIRRVKARHRITYVPFVHDLIPVMTPEHCVKELTQDFITWILGVFQHADMFLVNSEATRRDLLSVASTLGHAVGQSDVEVVRLDADFRQPESRDGGERALRQWGLRPDGYVLMVSTIESRKNHFGAFNAWMSLIRKHGFASVPYLVCVGNAGWLNDDVHAKLAGNEVLRSRVKMLSHLSDEHLAALYKHSLFTLYPSHYEGWGLPVTESLCYGKVALVSDSSSLPEAGGQFADYFTAGSDQGLAAAAERLIFDPEYRVGREARIATGFRPRPWADIGRQIRDAVSRLHDALLETDGVRSVRAAGPLEARLGVYYPLTRNLERRIWRGMAQGEMFRAGAGWWWPEDWGVWAKPGGGEMAFRVSGPHGPLRAYVRIRGLLGYSCQWYCDMISPVGKQAMTGRLGPNEWRWLLIDLPRADEDTIFRASLTAEETQDLAPRTGGLDRRVTSLGLSGFYVCERDDFTDRMAFNEALALNDFTPLTPGFENR